jgi:hypothetical protein
VTEIVLPDAGPDGEAWTALCELADGYDSEWVLVGARVVELHGLEQGRTPPRRSADLDTITNARTHGSRPRDLATWLIDHGYHLDLGPEGLGHRFRRGAVSIDVLAPDHLGARADLTTVHGARTIQVPGGTRALRAARPVPVRCRNERAVIPVPDLLGALIAKSAAVKVDDAPASQRLDLAFLYSLLVDPAALKPSPSERRILATVEDLRDPNHEAWLALDADATDAWLAYRTLTQL